MKVFISTDIEGCTGVASFAQCGKPTSEYYDYAFARRMMTHDVNAAIRGARAAGATKVVVKDAHATCRNLLIDELEPQTELISGFTMGGDGMMDGIDESFDAALLIGYHALAGLERGMMDHALIGGLHRFWIDGVEAGEIAVSAAIANAYGVPLVAVTSDAVACQEALEAIPGVAVYSTKEGYGHFMGRALTPAETGPEIASAVSAALRALAEPARKSARNAATKLRASFRTMEEADMAALAPGVERPDGYTIEVERESFLEAHAAMQVVFTLSMAGRRSED